MFVLLFWMIQDYIHKSQVATLTAEQAKELGIAITTMPMENKLSKILQFVKAPLAIRER